MKNSALIKLLTALAVVILIIAVILGWRKSGAPETGPGTPATDAAADRSTTQKPAGGTMLSMTGGDLVPDDLKRSMFPREKVEAWLKLHGRSAASLLAAFRALGDTNYLNEAAAAYPNDPEVEWTVLARDAFPADRRKWLELLKQSLPDDAVGFYLSAGDYFKDGNSDQAIRELQAASDKNGFDNHENDSRQNSEDLYAYLGSTKLEAAIFSWADISGDLMTTLAVYKQVGQGLADAQKQALDAGKVDSVSDLYDMGTTLVDNLQNGDDGDYLISQLVGIAVQNILLSQLNPNTKYDFLDDNQTPAQAIQELKDERAAIRQLEKSFQAAYSSMTLAEMLDYSERVKDDGELDAMQWVVDQHSPAAK